MKQRIESAFNIHAGEGRMVALVLAYAMLLYFSNVMARTASTALFLGEYDAATLPYTYVILMVVGPLVSLIYLRLNNRFALSRVLMVVHGFLLLTLIVLPLVLNQTTAPVLLFTLPIYFAVNNSLTISSFWNLLGRIYNIRQGKRLFGLLSSGEHMSTIFAGFLAPVFVSRIGTANLYWIGAFFMVLTIVLLFLINRDNSEKLGNVVAAQSSSRSRESGLGELIKEPYVRLIFALFGLFIIGIVMVGNINYSQAEIRFPTADSMATYVGVFMGIFGVLSLIIQWFVAGRVMDRFGVRSMIMATPAGLFIFMLVFAAVGTFTEFASALFWISAGAAMYQAILDAVDSAAINIMYQPLPGHLRTQAQTTVIGVVYPIAIGAAGILLIFLLDVLGFDAVQLSYATLVVIALWLFVGIRLGRAYPKRLRQALQQRSLGGLALPRPDRNSIGVFEDALQSQHPAVVLYALDMLEEVAPETLPNRLPALLANPDEGVQTDALRRIAGLSWDATPDGVTTLLRDSSNAAVRATALRTWVAVNADEATANLETYSQDEQPEVRTAALTLMRLNDDVTVRRKAEDAVAALAGSSNPADRIIAANVIGDTAIPTQSTLLLALLQDEEAGVRRAAMEAAARTRFPDTWPAIILALSSDETRAQAATALSAGGEAVFPALQDACVKPDPDPLVLAGVAEVCGRIGGEQAVAILAQQLQHPDAAVRHQALLGLSQCAYQAEGQARDEIDTLIQAESARAAAVVAAQVDVGGKQPVLLTADALDKTRLLLTDNLMLLLSFLDESQTVMSAREALKPGAQLLDDERSAYAIEAIDILLDHEQKELMFPFFQEFDQQERLEKASKRNPQELLGREQRLLALLADDSGNTDYWTKLSVIYSLGLLGDDAAADPVVETAVRSADDPLLVETALNSLEELRVDLGQAAAQNPTLVEATAAWEARDPKKLTTLQKTEVLKQGSVFAHLPNDVLVNIAGLMIDVYAVPGQAIIEKGDPGDYLYVVVDGHMRVHDGDRSYDTLGAGGVAGEMALLDAQPRSATVTAVADSHLLRLDQEPFYDLLAGQPALARDLIGLLSMRLRARTADLSQAQPRQDARSAVPVVSFQPGTKSIAAQGQLMDLEKVVILKGVELFGESDEDLLGQLAVLFEEVDLAGGETLFEAGDPGQSLYVVTVGQVSVHLDDRVLAYLGEGEVFGEMALLESEPRLASVTAVIPTQLLRLDQQPFFELMETKPELARGIITMLSRRLRGRWDQLAVEQVQPVEAA